MIAKVQVVNTTIETIAAVMSIVLAIGLIPIAVTITVLSTEIITGNKEVVLIMEEIEEMNGV